ncbi:hypothetical protein CIRMBP1292_00679 [Enterococcus cecorum]|nr:hypothetical protein CIRMBP1292_00679 [Enterococcus cecorum]
MKKNILLGLICIASLSLAACSSQKEQKTSESTKASSTVVTKTKESTTTSTTTQKADQAPQNQSDFVATAAEANFDGKMLRGNSYSVRITEHKVIQPGEAGNEGGDKPLIAFYFDTLVNSTYDNSAPLTPSIAWTLNFHVVQDNDPNKVNELQFGVLNDATAETNSYAEIKPGGTVSSAVAYQLTDTTTPVNLIAGDLTGTQFGTAEFSVK